MTNILTFLPCISHTSCSLPLYQYAVTYSEWSQTQHQPEPSKRTVLISSCSFHRWHWPLEVGWWLTSWFENALAVPKFSFHSFLPSTVLCIIYTILFWSVPSLLLPPFSCLTIPTLGLAVSSSSRCMYFSDSVVHWNYWNPAYLTSRIFHISMVLSLNFCCVEVEWTLLSVKLPKRSLAWRLDRKWRSLLFLARPVN
jgi:hypothetical protein